MSLIIGYMNSDHNIHLAKLDKDISSFERLSVSSSDLSDLELNLLITNENIQDSPIEEQLNKEKAYYPVIEASNLNLNKDDFDTLSSQEVYDIYDKVNDRWLMRNNLQTLESIVQTVSYLKNLWTTDRDNFFEEYWYLLKTNLATFSLDIVYHDVRVHADKEDKKPELIYSAIKGKKIPNIQPASDIENQLMKEYSDSFDIFNITHLNLDKNEVVIASMIDQSPILIMAKLNNLNQLQRSLLTALMRGLQS